MRILLDTNVLLRAAKPNHAQYQASVDAIDLLGRQGHELIVVPQVLYEFWSVATRPLEQNGLGMLPADADRELDAIQRFFRLYRDERAVFSFWRDLVRSLGIRGKQGHDARLAAAMQRHAIPFLLTFNTADFARYSFVTAVAPSAIVTGAPIA